MALHFVIMNIANQNDYSKEGGNLDSVKLLNGLFSLLKSVFICICKHANLMTSLKVSSFICSCLDFIGWFYVLQLLGNVASRAG